MTSIRSERGNKRSLKIRAPSHVSHSQPFSLLRKWSFSIYMLCVELSLIRGGVREFFFFLFSRLFRNLAAAAVSIFGRSAINALLSSAFAVISFLFCRNEKFGEGCFGRGAVHSCRYGYFSLILMRGSKFPVLRLARAVLTISPIFNQLSTKNK